MQFEGSRSAQEIQKFWQSFEHPSINKQEWSAEEVERLRAIAAAHGHLEWHLVAEELGVSTRPGPGPGRAGRTRGSRCPRPLLWKPKGVWVETEGSFIFTGKEPAALATVVRILDQACPRT